MAGRAHKMNTETLRDTNRLAYITPHEAQKPSGSGPRTQGWACSDEEAESRATDQTSSPSSQCALEQEVQQLVANCMIWMFAAKAASAFIGKHLKGESDSIGCAIIGQHRCIEMVSANEMGQLPINAGYRTSQVLERTCRVIRLIGT